MIRPTRLIRPDRGGVVLLLGLLLTVAALAAPNETAAQLLRNVDRATITATAADHEPFAKGQMVRIAVEVEMLRGMHVNANPPTHDWLIPVEVSVRGVNGVSVLEAFYPDPKSVKFPYDDAPYLVYEGTFVIGLLVAIPTDVATGGRELEVVLDYQACNDEACFPPTETSVKVPIMIVGDVAESREVSSPLLDRAPFPRR